MKSCSAQPKSHNLNIQMYSFRELLELFQLTSTISIDDLQRAKKMVLKMHPDKSRLPSEYFLFYKKAFDIIVQYYQETAKTTTHVPTTKQTYSPINEPLDKTTARTVNKVIHEMGPKQFHEKFNELFDSIAEKPNQDTNEWFKKNDPLYEFDTVSSASGLGQAMESVRQKSAALTKYTGVETMTSHGPAYGNLYDNEETYVSCDPFGKLKYDDLRKVHKDQTVLAVSERDIDKVRTYSSMDHLQRERGSLHVEHVDRSEHERFFAEQQQMTQQRIAEKQHAAKLKSLEYAEKNKSVMATFLKLM